jgi:hypothetical protein
MAADLISRAAKSPDAPAAQPEPLLVLTWVLGPFRNPLSEPCWQLPY